MMLIAGLWPTSRALPSASESTQLLQPTFHIHTVDDVKDKVEAIATKSHMIRTQNAIAEKYWGFTANTSEAQGIYQGCDRIVTEDLVNQAEQTYGKRPGLILIGAQKAGTSSVNHALEPDNDVFCTAGNQELHFFDDEVFAERTIGQSEFEVYLNMWESRCSVTQVDPPRFEKTPGYLTQPWAALRLCQTLPYSKLALVLREPVARAYSSFYQNSESDFVAGGGKINVTRTPEGFHQLAVLDVAISQQCGGFAPEGDSWDKAYAAENFTTCCEGVAATYDQFDWPGCSCSMHTDSYYINPSGTDKKHHICGYYGDQRAMMVRNSVYVKLLRNHYRYHNTDHVLIFPMDAVNYYLTETTKEMGFFALPPSLTDGRKQRIKDETRIDGETHANTHDYDPILYKTQAMLDSYYAPYNEELFSLIGRNLTYVWG